MLGLAGACCALLDFAGLGMAKLVVACFHYSNMSSLFPFLAKTGFFIGVMLAFFSHVFLTSIFLRFFFDFGGVLEAKMVPTCTFCVIFGGVFSHLNF